MIETLPPKPELLEAIAQILTEAARDVEDIGTALCSDQEVAVQFAYQLQGIDRLAQVLNAAAKILESDDPVSAIDHLGLAEISKRLAGTPHTKQW